MDKQKFLEQQELIFENANQAVRLVFLQKIGKIISLLLISFGVGAGYLYFSQFNAILASLKPFALAVATITVFRCSKSRLKEIDKLYDLSAFFKQVQSLLLEKISDKNLKKDTYRDLLEFLYDYFDETFNAYLKDETILTHQIYRPVFEEELDQIIEMDLKENTQEITDIKQTIKEKDLLKKPLGKETSKELLLDSMKRLGFSLEQMAQVLKNHSESDYLTLIILLESRRIPLDMLYCNFDLEDPISLIDEKVKEQYQDALKLAKNDHEKDQIKIDYYQQLIMTFEEKMEEEKVYSLKKKRP